MQKQDLQRRRTGKWRLPPYDTGRAGQRDELWEAMGRPEWVSEQGWKTGWEFTWQMVAGKMSSRRCEEQVQTREDKGHQGVVGRVRTAWFGSAQSAGEGEPRGSQSH